MPPLYRVDARPDLEAPVLVAAFDGWVDAGSAATAALVHEIFPDMPAATARVRDLLRHGVTPGPRP